MPYAIGLDLGSQSLKGQLLAPDGEIAGEARGAYATTSQHPGWAEAETEGWFAAITDVVQELVHGASLKRTDVAAIAFASQVDGVVLVDEGGQTIRPAIMWLDRRAEAEAHWLAGRLSAPTARTISGLNIDSMHAAPKLLWLRSHEPDAFARAVTYHVPGSWAVARLTGRSVVDPSNASCTLLYDLRRRRWSEDLLDAATIDRTNLPAIAEATEVAGTLTLAAAAELGLSESCRVAVGSGDEHAAALAAGVIAGGPVCDISGTAEPVAVAAAEPVVDDSGLTETHAHAVRDVWLIENPGFVSGGSVRWFNDTIGRTSFRRLTQLAAEVRPGADGLTFIPALSGSMTPRWNGRARGTFHGLSMASTLSHLARAVFEGCAFGVRDIVDRFEALGLGRGEIRVVGGGSRSDVLLQLKADVTGRAVRRVKNPEATATGAAMIAGVVAGTFANLDEAGTALTRLEAGTFEPDPANTAAYEDAYRAYRDLYDSVEPGFGRFAPS